MKRCSGASYSIATLSTLLFCDKIASRDYIADRVGIDKLPELLWVGDKLEEIPFDDLAALML